MEIARMLPREKLYPGNFTKRDVLQVRAFHAAYRLLHDLPQDERFITAICQTSDEMYEKADKAKIKEWEITYLRKAGRSHY
jgi:hypothetical protein